MRNTIPQQVTDICLQLRAVGFEAYPVGGCVRDIILDKKPKDWDVTTNAKPEEVQDLFPDSFYENEFGTVGVKVDPFLKSALHKIKSSPSNGGGQGVDTEKKDIIEVTTYRTESTYSDNRHPDEVQFVETLEEDLRRRDFTMNAMAINISSLSLGGGQGVDNDEKVPPLPGGGAESDEAEGVSATSQNNIIDPFHGLNDIQNKQIRAVGNAKDRFSEDALRMMRAIRFACELDFDIEKTTYEAIIQNADNLRRVAPERIIIELEKIIMSDKPAKGIDILQKTGLLKHILPELEEGIGVTQNLHHTYTVWEHNIKALETCPSKKFEVRLAALLHDVGKPRTKRGNGKYATFYNHDHVGARMTRKILERLKFPRKIIDKTTLLVDQHLFYYNVDEVTEAAVRRVIKRVGLENIKDLIDVRIGDRLGSGVPKAKPYRLRHFEYMVEKVSRDPISVKMLKINGQDLMGELSIKPGPKIGAILDVLLGEVIEDAGRNTRDYLLSRARELDTQSLADLRSTAKRRIEAEQKNEEEHMKKKYWVK